MGYFAEKHRKKIRKEGRYKEMENTKEINNKESEEDQKKAEKQANFNRRTRGTIQQKYNTNSRKQQTKMQ